MKQKQADSGDTGTSTDPKKKDSAARDKARQFLKEAVKATDNAKAVEKKMARERESESRCGCG